MLGDPQGIDEHQGFDRGQASGDIDEHLHADAGDGRGPLRRILHDLGLQGLEAGAAAFDILLIIEIFGDQDMHQPIEEGHVGADLNGHVDISEFGQLGAARIATMSWAPLRTAFFRNVAATGWASVILEPITKNILALAKSAKELVIAPEPNEVASPATVGACQVRAQ